MNKGFTLIEVVVVIAIVSILAGIMIPFIYRVWENAEIETTKERMSDLKKAMVGDPRLIQNGVRIHYGYVGDCGALPSTLEKLIIADLNECPNWKGPYLPAGFDSSDYNRDAWDEVLIYDPVQTTLMSKGADRISGTADDITLGISQNEITEAMPISSIKGNINFSFYNSTPNPVTPLYYSKVTELLYSQTSNCMPLNIGNINSGETKSVIQSFNISINNKLTKGKIIGIRSSLSNDPSCGNVIGSTDINVFVSSLSEELFINIPFSYTIQ